MTNPNENNQTPDLSPLAQDLIQTEAPDDALEALLAELEETAAEVRTELEARRRNAQQLISDDAAARAEVETEAQEPVTERTETVVKPAYAKKLNPNVTPEQAEELENFPDYFGTPKGTWANLFKMLRDFRAEMRESKHDA
ncbi:hypothetical protein CGLAU_11270 [Corynebacterium glaucum]|uniref:Uncharacterized protein n=1 Tax=Corynebacterium glaucum TaxID=187491 RepID=A0A1Q2HZ98_9CORY|nr:hypothetical protein [Corynebacterium glaucum]AQQ16186.1 hypothetical protein CGLAU_11270 [Corynebacterium glaucum]